MTFRLSLKAPRYANKTFAAYTGPFCIVTTFSDGRMFEQFGCWNPFTIPKRIKAQRDRIGIVCVSLYYRLHPWRRGDLVRQYKPTRI